jgi:acyl carrier protein
MSDQTESGNVRSREMTEKPASGWTTETINARLSSHLEMLLVGAEGSLRYRAEDIGSDADFVELGVNSVDYLQFVIAIEQEFDLEVPDDLIASKTLLSLRAWEEYLAGRLVG